MSFVPQPFTTRFCRYYGGSTATNMQRELHKNGPFVVGFNTNGWAYHYESGVLLDMDSRETDLGEAKTKFVI